MPIVTKGELIVDKKQFGAKISREVLEKLHAYSEYVQQPIGYCVDRLLNYAMGQDPEFQAYLKSKESKPGAVTEEKA